MRTLHRLLVRLAVAALLLCPMGALAAPPPDDTWVRLDRQAAGGDPAGARAKAAALDAPDAPALRTYLEAVPTDEAAAARRTLAQQARAALRELKFALVVERTDKLPTLIDDVASVEIELDRGLALNMLGRYAPAREILLRVAARAGRLGWLSRERLGWQSAAEQAYLLGRYDEAKAEWTKAVAIAKRVGDEFAAGRLLGNLGLIAWHRGKLDEALEMHRGSLTSARAAKSPKDEARALTNIGNVQKERGAFDEAEAAFHEAIKVARASENEEGVATALTNVGLVYYDRGNYVKALETQQQALEMKKRLGDRRGIGITLVNLANAHEALDEYSAALPHLEHALKVFRELGFRRGESAAVGSLGLLHRKLGNYALALRHLEASKAIDGAIGNVLGYAKSVSNLGAIYNDLGRLEQALAHHRESLAMSEAVGDRAGAVTSRHNVATSLMNLGRLDEAETELKAVLAAERALGRTVKQANVLASLASLSSRRQAYDEAIRLFREADAVLRPAGHRRRSIRARLNIGLCHYQMRKYAAAVAAIQPLVAEAREIGHADLEVDIHAALGACYCLLHQFDKALEVALAGEKRARVMTSGHADTLGASVRQSFGDIYRVGALASRFAGDVAQVVWFLERGKAGAFLEAMGGGERMRGVTLPAGLARGEAVARAELRAAQDQLIAASRTGKRRAVRAARQRIESAEVGLRTALETIQREAKAAALVTHPEIATVPEIQAALGPDEAIVLYGIYEANSGFALIITPKRTILSATNTKEVVDAAIDAVLMDEAPWIDRSKLPELKHQLVDAISLPKSVRRVLIAPDERLAYVPFSLLMPSHEVVSIPSATVWLRLRERDPKVRAETSVLAVGDPVYRDTAGKATHRGSTHGNMFKLAPLPGTRAEVEAIGDVQLLGAKATASEVRKQLAEKSRWRALHFACHGLLHPDKADLSALALTRGGGTDTGFLTALDVFRWRVPADLVALSACESARGEVFSAEGLMGLPRSFLHAGASTVLGSLWKVDDTATQALMTRFYAEWNPDDPAKRVSAAEALRRAQAHVKSQPKWKHPYYWAAWVLWGSGR